MVGIRMLLGHHFKHLLRGCCSIKSPVDEKQMDGIPSVKIHSGTDYISNSHLIRWTEVFILQVREEESEFLLYFFPHIETWVEYAAVETIVQVLCNIPLQQ